MSKRRTSARPLLPDWHLWTEVARTVSPLHRRPDGGVEPDPPAEPHPPAPVPRPRRTSVAMPSYQAHAQLVLPPRPGIEPNLRQRLMRGRVEIDGTLDLHGMRQAEAHRALTKFLNARAARGDRTLLVITGKGLARRGDDATIIVERGILRAMLPVWLGAPDLAPLVSGWDAAAQSHGGEGAFYVRLRRERRSS
jgi:DNA-nicking Smr family endonuclease